MFNTTLKPTPLTLEPPAESSEPFSWPCQGRLSFTLN